MARRTSLSRNGLTLLLGAVGLLLFIAMLGDFRRVNNAMTQAQGVAATLQGRVADGVALPLHLDPGIPPEQRDKHFQMEWLTPDEARRLRDTGGTVIAAQSVVLPRLLGADGRAVILFENGRFRAEWLSEKAFHAAMAIQRERSRNAGAVTP